jgi:hypothetical protein
MGNEGFLCVRGRSNVYGISIELSEGKSEDAFGEALMWVGGQYY